MLSLTPTYPTMSLISLGTISHIGIAMPFPFSPNKCALTLEALDPYVHKTHIPKNYLFLLQIVKNLALAYPFPACIILYDFEFHSFVIINKKKKKKKTIKFS